MGIKGLPRVTGGYQGLQGVTRGYKGLQRVTGGYKGLQGVTAGDKGLQGFTKSRKACFLTRTSPNTFSGCFLHKSKRSQNFKFLTKTME